MIEIAKVDITTLAVDAIVNAANAQLAPGGGVDGAIHRAAGPALHEELQRRYDGCQTGAAVVTGGHRLRARYVIHTVGPIWSGGGADEEELLARCYESVFARARELGDVRSIAFPAISTGVYGFPKSLAASIAWRAMRAHEGEVDRIVAALFDEESLRIYQELLDADA